MSAGRPGGRPHRGHPVPRDEVRRRRRRLGPGSTSAGGGRTSPSPRLPEPWKATTSRPTTWLAAATGPALPVVVKGVLRADDARALSRRGRRGGLRLQPRWAPARPQREHGPSPGRGGRGGGGPGGGVRRRWHPAAAWMCWPPWRWAPGPCSSGRPALYALAVDGAPGVERLLTRPVRRSSREAMVLAGCATPGDTRDLPRRTQVPQAADLRCSRVCGPGSRDPDLRCPRSDSILFSPVARVRREARPRGRASGPEADHPALNEALHRVELLRV